MLYIIQTINILDGRSKVTSNAEFNHLHVMNPHYVQALNYGNLQQNVYVQPNHTNRVSSTGKPDVT